MFSLLQISCKVLLFRLCTQMLILLIPIFLSHIAYSSLTFSGFISSVISVFSRFQNSLKIEIISSI
ncbi:TPA: hypothetical protein DEG21_05610 [Patescibacteria group bacterium]|nr:hypothetical protein [Candidatus Gracilibacteria bacterium]HBY75298.1 hypothetical protein [Candidatus Gracilibacteria bacterium]